MEEVAISPINLMLQKITFPKKDICEEAELYFKSFDVDVEANKVKFLTNGALLSASTYFNSFSLDKWKKYTSISNLHLNLRLKGNFSVALKCMQLKNNSRVNIISLGNYQIESEDAQDFEFEFDFKTAGIAYWELTSLSEDAYFYGGYYSTYIDNANINEVKLAVGICTYRREEFVVSNIKRFIEAINDKNSLLYNKVKVFVSDNGQTIKEYGLDDKAVQIVYNKNLGGAGGFTRCLVEALYKKDEGFTNFLFLDDDIILNIDAIEKNIALLSVLLPQFKNSVIGGAMFSTDLPYLQFENAAKWQRTGFVFNRRDIDMRDNVNILLNEQPYDVNYNAWCYCCIPFNIINKNNLPLPVFFHMDDVEYGLRNKLPVITLNGINVWHLYKKQLINAKNDYYDIRNRLIMVSELNPEAAKEMAYMYLNSFTKETLRYHYARAINAFDAILDFCKGFDWFKHLDTLKKHQCLFNNTVWKDSTPQVERSAHISLCANENNRKYKFKAAVKTLMPSFGKSTVVYNENSIEDVLGKKSVKVYVASEKKFIEYKKSISLAIKCWFKHIKIARILKSTKFDSIVKEYNQRINELQNLDFWEKYLNLPNTLSKTKKVLFVASDNDATSGAFRSMVVLNKFLNDKYGIDTTILLPKQGDGVSLIRENGLKYTTIESEDWIVRLNSSKKDINRKKEAIKLKNSNAIYKICEFIKNEKFDLVHINTSYSYVGMLAALRCNVPVVWHIREFLEEDQERRMIDKKYGYSLMEKADSVIAVSKSIQAKYVGLLKTNNIQQIYNGIDVGKFYLPNKQIFSSNKTVFICVGAIAPYKGQMLVIEAIQLLKNKGFNFDYEVWYVGSDSGDYARNLHSKVAEYSIQDKVKFLGRRQDVNELYAKSDIACVCSRSEAFGRITVEAMLSGNLLIGANTAGTQEIVNDEVDGLLFEAENAVSLSEKIEYALTHKDAMQALAANGREASFRKFSAERNADEVYDTYKRIWESRK